jgi:chaperonin GroEL (HSP60 family)
MRRVEKATGARVLTTLSDLRQEQLGNCELFEEK